MMVNIAVCGGFHYYNYVRYLDQEGLLNRVYYSHKLSTDAAGLGIHLDRAINLWPKEYLIRLHGMLTKGWLVPEFYPYYAELWQLGALRRWDRCDILHLMLHGTALKLIQRAKDEGGKVIVEPVNHHPHEMNEILGEETERLGLRKYSKQYRIQQRQLEEAAASDFLLAPSHTVRDSFVKRGYIESRTHVLPYGVDLSRFRPIEDDAKSSRTFRVICVAQISPRKGHIYLLEAWKKLRLPNAELELIGPISYEMRAILHKYADIFRHLSFVPNDRLFEHYARASIFVLPSLEDGFGCVIVEAMACGLPVITTANTGAAEIITQGKEGFVVPIRSPESIAEQLELLYGHEELRREMSLMALSKVRSQLSWETYAKRLCRFYRSTSNGEREQRSLE
jgi:glycosyltransferase involved in cell wall biosynthesis